ncbi:alpha/beta hydrolase [Haematospirillum jordaniae]|uniref:KANL3/Tex30 alpha/beta hydrolase-like domain-containing protein n=1 Tax=Haematospirillum jordaniae TaxID=1549855 RepID=A0A143DF60_9PROT|nr:alpha/beta family hydrolase [Haematospirillum jordaniae]AMW34758.1 hypothetical protein AY555_05705 [Haematospirillum jordaniae]NKD45499.1 alpha/beta hydrolase [Haematospirillum jordaniae]NKD56884.1 alpha/beta hydrolase [Haematospirillum jordaniae]NKD58960.1 alpha/beta hydrolase [Haematospirillum jordaniae]NKD66809.1 alpha/beta hydrolase [Haematospirillum jordaniae]
MMVSSAGAMAAARGWMFDGPAGPCGVPLSVPLLILAHGAGAPMDSPFMNAVAGLVSEAGVAVLRFEFPYMAARRAGHGGRRPPDREPVLLQTWVETVAQARALFRPPCLAIGGKSMGGRMAVMVAAEVGADGVVALGYPFHPARKPGRVEKRCAPLENLSVPGLIVQGTRDPLGGGALVDTLRLPSSLDILWMCDGDHDLRPRVSSGYRVEEHLCRAAGAVADFVAMLPGKGNYLP